MFLRSIRDGPYWLRNVFRQMMQIYYCMVRILFIIWNFFIKKRYVDPPGDTALFISATKAVVLIKQRKLKSLDLVNAYIKRIEEVNPLINAVAYKNYHDARRQAKELDEKIETMDDEELFKYAERKFLLGIPFHVKASIQVKGMPVSSGVYARRNSETNETADVVARMEHYGGILLAIGTVSEYCTWIESSSKLFGLTNNPFDLRKTAGGCSGGDAALLGAGAALISVASDFAGSARQPAFFNGVFSLLPTPGLISNHGHFPKIDGEKSYKSIMGRMTPMCRYAEDLTLMIEVMSRIELRKEIPEKPTLFYYTGLKEYLFIEPINKKCLDSMFQAVRFYEELADQKAEEVSFRLSKYMFEYMLVSIRQHIYEPLMADVMNDSWTNLDSKDRVNCFQELVKYVRGKSSHTLAGILYGLTDDSDMFEPNEKAEMIVYRDQLKDIVVKLLCPHGLIFFPSFPTQATFHGELIPKRWNMSHTVFANVLGLPAVQCPMGLDEEGLPLGVMVMGPPNSENYLIDVAKKLSKEFGGWTPPGMVGSL